MCKLVPVSTNKDIIYVADIKKSYIQNILDNIHICDKIELIMLFGSAVTDHCREQSDIDVAIFGSATRSEMYHSEAYKQFIFNVVTYEKDENSFQDYDTMYFSSGDVQDCPIIHEIAKKGRILYDKGDRYDDILKQYLC